MTDLSPAAQAVLDAFENASDGEYVEGVWIVDERTMLAAALRAAADQVVPDHANSVGDAHDNARRDQWMRIRRKLLAIAAELEAQ
jgi:hypothetical protein